MLATIRARPRRAGLLLAALLIAAITTQIPLRDTDTAVYLKAAQRLYLAHEDPYPRRDGDRLPFTYPPTAFPLLWPIASLSEPQLAAAMLGVNLLLTALLTWTLTGDLARGPTPVSRVGAAIDLGASGANRPNIGPSPSPSQACGSSAAADALINTNAQIASRRLFFWGPIYIALFGGLYLSLQFGQINLLLLLLLWGFWRHVRVGRQPAIAGIWLTLGCMAKPHYALLGLGSGPRPRIALVTGALLSGAGLLALSLWLGPSSSWNSWWHEVVATTSLSELPPGHSSIAAPWNRSIPGAIARFLVPNKFSSVLLDDPKLAARLSAGAILLLLLLTAWMIWRSMQRDLHPKPTTAGARGPIDHDLELSLISITVFLISPASWTHHLVMLLPAALILLRDRLLNPGPALSSRLTAALVLAVLALTLDDLLPVSLRTQSLALMSLMTVGVIGLWLLLAEQLWRRTCKHYRQTAKLPLA